MANILQSALLSSIALTLTACGGGSSGSSSNGGTAANRAPSFTSARTVSVPEFTTAPFYNATASDPDNNTLSFAITGGADESLLSLNSSNQLSFTSRPDFDFPADQDGNNVYDVELTVNDGNGETAVLSLSITVTATGQTSVRNRDISFSQVDVQQNVLYRTVDSRQLRMDIYTPRGDTETVRPVIITAFGGGFVSGSRFVEEDAVRIARNFAQRGYVAAAIDYRLAPSFPSNEADLVEAIFNALQDTWAAVRFFREDANGANIYGTHPDAIFIGGQSAGGVIAKNIGILDEGDSAAMAQLSPFIGSGGLYGDGATRAQSQIQGFLSIAGATIANPFDVVDSGSAIMYAAHEEFDTAVPCSTAEESFSFTGLVVSGPCASLSAFQAAGVPAELYLVESRVGHISFTETEYAEMFQGAANFFYDNIINP